MSVMPDNNAPGTAEKKIVNLFPPRPSTSLEAPYIPPTSNVAFNPPDGGLLAWSQVLAAHLINCLVWGYPATYGVYQLYYVETLELPLSQVSWIGSIQIFLTSCVCTFSGRLADAGYVRHCVAAGCFLAVLGTFMVSLCTTYWQLVLAQGVCTGIGLGLAFMPAVATVSSYFKKNRGLALSVAASGSAVGALIFPSIVQYLIPQVGFPWAVRCAAFVALVLCVIANLLLKPYLPPRKAGPMVEWGAFRELPYVLFALGGFLHSYTLYFGFFYMNSYAKEKLGFTTVEAVSVLLIANALGIPSRPIVGYIADNYFGSINVYMIVLCYLGITIYSWIAVETRTAMYVFAVFWGFAAGASQGCFVGSLASLTTNPQKMGTRFGMVTTITGFATLAGTPTGGAIIDQSGGDYKWAFVWGGTCAICASLTVVASRIATTGWKLKIKI